MKNIIYGALMASFISTGAIANCVNAYQDRLINLQNESKDNLQAGLTGSIAGGLGTAAFNYALTHTIWNGMLIPINPAVGVAVSAAPTLTNATQFKNEIKGTEKGLQLIKESELGGGVLVNEVSDKLSSKGYDVSPEKISKMVTEYNDYGELCQGEIPMGINGIERKLELDLN